MSILFRSFAAKLKRGLGSLYNPEKIHFSKAENGGAGVLTNVIMTEDDKLVVLQVRATEEEISYLTPILEEYLNTGAIDRCRYFARVINGVANMSIIYKVEDDYDWYGTKMTVKIANFISSQLDYDNQGVYTQQVSKTYVTHNNIIEVN